MYVFLAVARELGIDTKKCTSAAYSLKRFYQQHVNKQVGYEIPGIVFCRAFHSIQVRMIYLAMEIARKFVSRCPC
jgi:hypothetical protein